MPASTWVLLTLTAMAAPTPALPSEIAPEPAIVTSTLASRAVMVTSRALTWPVALPRRAMLS